MEPRASLSNSNRHNIEMLLVSKGFFLVDAETIPRSINVPRPTYFPISSLIIIIYFFQLKQSAQLLDCLRAKGSILLLLSSGPMEKPDKLE